MLYYIDSLYCDKVFMNIVPKDKLETPDNRAINIIIIINNNQIIIIIDIDNRYNNRFTCSLLLNKVMKVWDNF